MEISREVHMTQPPYPVKDGQAHPHPKGGSGEVNPFREIGEQLMTEAFHPESVAALQTYTTDMMYIRFYLPY